MNLPASGFSCAGDHAEQRRLARAVRADDADDPAGREREVHVLEQQLVAEGFGDVFGLDDLLPEPRAGRDVDLDLRLLLLLRPASSIFS